MTPLTPTIHQVVLCFSCCPNCPHDSGKATQSAVTLLHQPLLVSPAVEAAIGIFSMPMCADVDRQRLGGLALVQALCELDGAPQI